MYAGDGTTLSVACQNLFKSCSSKRRFLHRFSGQEMAIVSQPAISPFSAVCRWLVE
jgi:hypothetical protein